MGSARSLRSGMEAFEQDESANVASVTYLMDFSSAIFLILSLSFAVSSLPFLCQHAMHPLDTLELSPSSPTPHHPHPFHPAQPGKRRHCTSLQARGTLRAYGPAFSRMPSWHTTSIAQTSMAVHLWCTPSCLSSRHARRCCSMRARKSTGLMPMDAR